MKEKNLNKKYFVKFGLEYFEIDNFLKGSHGLKYLHKQKFRSQKSPLKDSEIENLEKKIF